MSFHPSSRNAMGWSRLAAGKASSPQELARQLAWTRREFLRTGAGIALGSSLLPSSLFARTGIPAGKQKFAAGDRKSTRLNSSHSQISYAVFCLKKKKKDHNRHTACAT